MLKRVIKKIKRVLHPSPSDSPKENFFKGASVQIANSQIGELCNLAHHADVLNSTIGNRTSIGRYSIVRNSDIGKYCSISWNVTIGADHHPTERVSGHAAFFQKRFCLVDEDSSKGVVQRTIIGNDVLIGCGTIIKAGVHVADGCIIGMGSVVVKDTKPYTIVVGNPAREVKLRFEESIVHDLLKLEWWNMSDEFIRQNIESFKQPLTEEIIKNLIDKKEKL